VETVEHFQTETMR